MILVYLIGFSIVYLFNLWLFDTKEEMSENVNLVIVGCILWFITIPVVLFITIKIFTSNSDEFEDDTEE